MICWLIHLVWGIVTHRLWNMSSLISERLEGIHQFKGWEHSKALECLVPCEYQPVSAKQGVQKRYQKLRNYLVAYSVTVGFSWFCFIFEIRYHQESYILYFRSTFPNLDDGDIIHAWERGRKGFRELQDSGLSQWHKFMNRRSLLSNLFSPLAIKTSK